MGKLFRNRESLSDTALLARESIQNSWDAARKFRKMVGYEVPFSVRFRYRDFSGEEREQMIESLGLRELNARRSSLKRDSLPDGNILDNLDNPEVPLKVLYVEDWGSHGLYGHPDMEDDSHLFLALYLLGGSDKDPESGGSYGFGKSALERASRINSVIAHSTFAPTPEDETTTRLVGFTWWGAHRANGQRYEGRAMFADTSQSDGPEPTALFDPYDQDAATDLASTLGMSPRNPQKEEDLGTSFLIIDPAIEPEDLKTEVEKWWWPALEDHLFDVSIVEPQSGEVLHPQPAENDYVASFIPAYQIATGQGSVIDPATQRLASEKWKAVRDVGVHPGSLALVAVDESGDDMDQSHAVSSQSEVALIRGPRMVIRYQPYGHKRVLIRGAFVASDDANPLLRDTEPSSHESWDTNPSSDVSPEATKMAGAVLDRIAKQVRAMVTDIAPPPPRNRKSLNLFSSLLSKFFTQTVGPPPPPPPGGEPIELQLPGGHDPEPVDDNNLRISTKMTVRLQDKAPAASATVDVTCTTYINEDDSNRGSKLTTRVRPAGRGHGFTKVADNVWRGEISKSHKASFVIETDSYLNLWTATLVPSVERISEWGDS